MTNRELLRAHLPHTVPTLLAERTVIILSPATADPPWAARAAWDLARAAARGGRRTAFVDLHLEAPVLASGATEVAEEGIVDAFVFDVSLTHVARAQDVAELYFIGVGTLPSDPEEVWTSPRWRRLSRGFAAEKALLLLFAPPSILPRLAVEADGLIVLAPTGFDPAAGAFPGISQFLERGTPLLGVVTERESPGKVRSTVRTARLPRQRSLTPILAAVLMLVAALVAGRFLFGDRDAPRAPRASSPGATTRIRGAAANASLEDSLFYSVQVASFNTLRQAMALASTYEQDGWMAAVTPVRRGADPPWYRVLVGALDSPAHADSLLRVLWARGVLDRSQGTIQRTPATYLLGAYGSAAEAREVTRGLRARGVPAYIVTGAAGVARVFVGAFTETEQASAADSILASAGLTADLVSRSGTAR